MTTKEYLWQISDIERKIRIKKSEIENLRELSYSPSIKMDGERVQTSSDQDPLARTVIKILQEEERLQEMIDKYLEVRNKISSQIESLDNRMHADILYGVYVANISLRGLENIVNYSKRSLIRHHGYAMKEFERKFKDSYVNYLEQTNME